MLSILGMTVLIDWNYSESRFFLPDFLTSNEKIKEQDKEENMEEDKIRRTCFPTRVSLSHRVGTLATDKGRSNEIVFPFCWASLSLSCCLPADQCAGHGASCLGRLHLTLLTRHIGTGSTQRTTSIIAPPLRPRRPRGGFSRWHTCCERPCS